MSTDQVQSVTRAFKILEQFSLLEDELAITDIKMRVGLPISTVHRLLSTLENLGYISQNQKNGKYRLGYKAFVLGSKVKTLRELGKVAGEYLKPLSVKYNETAHYAIESENKVLCVEKIDAQRKLIYTPGVGETHHLHATSVGKSILAFYSEEKRNHIIKNLTLSALTVNTICDLDKLKQELYKIRQQGYAIDNQESEIGLYCFGVPVIERNGNCIGAISLSIPVPRMTWEIEQVVKDLKETSEQISQALEK